MNPIHRVPPPPAGFSSFLSPPPPKREPNPPSPPPPPPDGFIDLSCHYRHRRQSVEVHRHRRPRSSARRDQPPPGRASRPACHAIGRRRDGCHRRRCYCWVLSSLRSISAAKGVIADGLSSRRSFRRHCRWNANRIRPARCRRKVFRLVSRRFIAAELRPETAQHLVDRSAAIMARHLSCRRCRRWGNG